LIFIESWALYEVRNQASALQTLLVHECR